MLYLHFWSNLFLGFNEETATYNSWLNFITMNLLNELNFWPYFHIKLISLIVVRICEELLNLLANLILPLSTTTSNVLHLLLEKVVLNQRGCWIFMGAVLKLGIFLIESLRWRTTSNMQMVCIPILIFHGGSDLCDYEGSIQSPMQIHTTFVTVIWFNNCRRIMIIPAW